MSTKIPRRQLLSSTGQCRAGGILTHDLLHPKQQNHHEKCVRLSSTDCYEFHTSHSLHHFGPSRYTNSTLSTTKRAQACPACGAPRRTRKRRAGLGSCAESLPFNSCCCATFPATRSDPSR